MGKVKMTSLTSVFEIFRDYLQMIEMIFSKIGNDLHALLKYSYVGFSFIISFGLKGLFGIPGKTEFWIYFVLQAILLSYLGRLALVEYRRKRQGIDAITWAEKPKWQIYLAKAMIFLITTLFYTTSSLCIHLLYNHSEYKKEFEDGIVFYKFMSVILLIEVVIVVQAYFLMAIKYSSPQIDTYDGTGRYKTDPKTSYYLGLEKIQSPFKFIYSEYFQTGKYYKVIVMIKKFILLLIIVGEVNQEKDLLIYLVQYALFLIVEAGFIFYQYKKSPYFKAEYNLVVCVFTIINIVCAILNIFVVVVTNKDSKGRLAIVIIQFILSTIYTLYILGKAVSTAHPKSKDFAKGILQYLDFTHIALRGKLDEKYEKEENIKYNLVFNKEVFNMDLECTLRIWHQYWDEQIFNLDEFKPPVPVEALPFVKYKGAPPYLRKFRGTIGERHEENLRIIRYIGLTKFTEELGKYRSENASFMAINQIIFNEFNGIDIYFPHQKSSSNFGKCSIFPFPFQISFSYDDTTEVIQLDKIQQFQELVILNRRPDIVEKKNLRLLLRSLDGEIVYFHHTCRESRRKSRRNSEGKTEYYSVGATVQYYNCLFSVLHSVNTPVLLEEGGEIDMGPGFSVQMKYATGQGIDDEGEHYTNNGRTFGGDIIGLSSSFVYTDKIRILLDSNAKIQQDNYPILIRCFEKYRRQQYNNFVEKVRVLSYNFMGLIYNADPDIFYDQNKIQAYLELEQNTIMHNLHNSQKKTFDNLYHRLDFVSSSTQNAYQYFFFLDVWENNSGVKQMKANEELLNPYLYDEACLAYKENIKRDELERILEQAGLRKPKGKGFFKDQILDQFFMMRDHFHKDNLIKQYQECQQVERQSSLESSLRFSIRKSRRLNHQSTTEYKENLEKTGQFQDNLQISTDQIIRDQLEQRTRENLQPAQEIVVGQHAVIDEEDPSQYSIQQPGETAVVDPNGQQQQQQQPAILTQSQQMIEQQTSDSFLNISIGETEAKIPDFSYFTSKVFRFIKQVYEVNEEEVKRDNVQDVYIVQRVEQDIKEEKDQEELKDQQQKEGDNNKEVILEAQQQQEQETIKIAENDQQNEESKQQSDEKVAQKEGQKKTEDQLQKNEPSVKEISEQKVQENQKQENQNNEQQPEATNQEQQLQKDSKKPEDQ